MRSRSYKVDTHRFGNRLATYVLAVVGLTFMGACGEQPSLLTANGSLSSAAKGGTKGKPDNDTGKPSKGTGKPDKGDPEPATNPGTTGERRVAVVLLRFTDNPDEELWTVEDIRDLVLGEASAFFWENSFGQSVLNGDVFGPFVIPVASTTSPCPIHDIQTEGVLAADSSEADLASFDTVMFVFNSLGCGGAGVAELNGRYVWINGLDGVELRPVVHELGHIFGLNHANFLDCGPEALGSDCVEVVYDDRFDAMGNRYAGHFSAYQKERLAWLGTPDTPPLATVTESGVYTIGPFESDDSLTKALKIPRGVDPSTGLESWLYVEYRQPIGFDTVFSTFSNNAFDGVLVHMATEGDGVFLLDATPDSQLLNGPDHSDAALEPGAVLADSITNISVSLLSADATGATVEVLLP